MSLFTYVMSLVVIALFILYHYTKAYKAYCYRNDRPVKVVGYISSNKGDDNNKYIIFRDVVHSNDIYISEHIENLKYYRMYSRHKVNMSERELCTCMTDRTYVLIINNLCILIGYFIAYLSSLIYFC